MLLEKTCPRAQEGCFGGYFPTNRVDQGSHGTLLVEKKNQNFGWNIFKKYIAELVRNGGNLQRPTMTGKYESREVIEEDPDGRQRVSANCWCRRAVGFNVYHA